MSFVELLVALTVTLVMASLVALVLAPWRLDFEARLETADVQQRLRSAEDALTADVAGAGAGAYAGSRTGPLAGYLPPVLPFRPGVDPPGTARDDVLTTIAVPTTAAQAALAQAWTAGSGSIGLTLEPGCPAGDGSCGFAAGMRVLVFDGTGAFDVLIVDAVAGSELSVRNIGPDQDHVYPAGAKIVEAVLRMYAVDPGDTESGPELVRDEGGGPQPVVDHLVRFAVEYEGDPLPPQVLAPADDPVGPWTTYGPPPPAADVAVGAWPAGENCVIRRDAASGLPVPRAGMSVLGPDDGPLVPLPSARLSDGPWCPDAAASGRYDADLLRIRLVRITVRVESALDALRGPASVLFSRTGTGNRARGLVPDREVVVAIAPRNLAGIR